MIEQSKEEYRPAGASVLKESAAPEFALGPEGSGAEEAREWLAAVVRSSDDAIIGKTLEGTITAWNPGAEKLFGYPSAEAMGKSMLMLVPADRANEETEILARIGRGEQVDHFETIRVRKDGRTIAISATISPIRNRSGVIVGASKIARDITERKRAEQKAVAQADALARQADALARSRQALEAQTLLLRSVLDSMVEGLVAVDEEGRFILWNPAAERIVGLGATNMPAQEWTTHYGLYLADTVTPFPADQNPLLRAMKGEVRTAEMFIRNRELSRGAWIQASASPLRDKAGAVRGGVVAFRDVTKMREDEREIRKLNDELEAKVAKRTAQLEEVNHELEAFTYSVSHDLRAPLRHISGFTRILLEEFGPSLPAEVQEYLRRIHSGTGRMGQLVDELLNLTRIGRQSLTLQPTDLNSVVDEVVTMLESDTAGRAVEWKISALGSVVCDPTLIRQVFQNLIGNALKYSRPRSPAVIEIGCSAKDKLQVIWVRDNGVGFDMRYADKLFGVFQRLHRPEEFEGTGIGLAIVDRILRKHGGRVWAEAELGRGATFYFVLDSSSQSGPGDTSARAGGLSWTQT
ncbi:MAG: PAS domain S-box protein [Terriglobales bacterium]